MHMPTFLCSSATLSGKTWTTCCFPNAADSRKQNVEPVVVSRQANTRPSQGPNIAPANIFWRREERSIICCKTLHCVSRLYQNGVTVSDSPGKRSRGWRRTACRGRRCRTATGRSHDVLSYKTWASLQAPAALPGQMGTSDWGWRAKQIFQLLKGIKLILLKHLTIKAVRWGFQ